MAYWGECHSRLALFGPVHTGANATPAWPCSAARPWGANATPDWPVRPCTYGRTVNNSQDLSGSHRHSAEHSGSLKNCQELSRSLRNSQQLSGTLRHVWYSPLQNLRNIQELSGYLEDSPNSHAQLTAFPFSTRSYTRTSGLENMEVPVHLIMCVVRNTDSEESPTHRKKQDRRPRTAS